MANIRQSGSDSGMYKAVRWRMSDSQDQIRGLFTGAQYFDQSNRSPGSPEWYSHSHSNSHSNSNSHSLSLSLTRTLILTRTLTLTLTFTSGTPDPKPETRSPE